MVYFESLQTVSQGDKNKCETFCFCYKLYYIYWMLYKNVQFSHDHNYGYIVYTIKYWIIPEGVAVTFYGFASKCLFFNYSKFGRVSSNNDVI